MKILSFLAAALGVSLASHVGWGNHADSPMNLEPRVFLARDSAGWKEYRKQFGHLRQFRNSTEEEFHARIFQDSEAMVKAQNDKFAKGESGFHMALNEFSDMAEAEYNSRFPTLTQDDVEHMHEGSIAFDVNAVMANGDSKGRRKRDSNWKHLTPKVKYQGQCGSCYAFAVVGAIEAHIMKKYGAQYVLSEQDIVDCTIAYGNYGCGGGYRSTTFSYAVKNGVNTESSYPYTAKVGNCRHSNDTYDSNIKVLSGFVKIPGGNETLLQAALNNIGPVTVFMNGSPRTFLMYSGGIYNDPSCVNRISHAILAVGLMSSNGTSYYLIKNSWGTGWGEGGYFRMAAGKNLCGIASQSAYSAL